MKLLVRCNINLHFDTSEIKLEVLSYYAPYYIQRIITPLINHMKVLLNFIQPNAPNLMGEY